MKGAREIKRLEREVMAMASYCPNCGKMLENAARFCPACGASMTEQTTSAQTAKDPWEQHDTNQAGRVKFTDNPVPPAYTPPTASSNSSAFRPAITKEDLQGTPFEPVSTGSFVGILLLMLIPLVNVIFLIVWACGGCRKINQQNFAKGFLIVLVIGVVIGVILGILIGLFVTNFMVRYGFDDDDLFRYGSYLFAVLNL